MIDWLRDIKYYRTRVWQRHGGYGSTGTRPDTIAVYVCHLNLRNINA